MTRSPTILTADAQGAALVEFGLVAPVLCLILMGTFDVGHTMYVSAVLQGEVQQAARASSLESATTAAEQARLDEIVRSQVRRLAGAEAQVTTSRRFYRNFADAQAARAEPFQDRNGNDRCDADEAFDDQNGNGSWDADGGDAGQGGAKDRTLYTVEVSYDRLFPLWRFVGVGQRQTLVTKTILENQPYTEQGTYAATSTPGTCK